MKFCGNEYGNDAGIIIDVDQDLTVIGFINALYLVNGKEVAFNVMQYSTYYDKHFRAYVLEKKIL